MLDLVTARRRVACATRPRAIERCARSGPVLVCCALGYSRSACAVAAWLAVDAAAPRASTQALARVRSARHGVRRAALTRHCCTASVRPMTLSDTIDDALAWRLRLTAGALAAVGTLDTLSTGPHADRRRGHRRRAAGIRRRRWRSSSCSAQVSSDSPPSGWRCACASMRDVFAALVRRRAEDGLPHGASRPRAARRRPAARRQGRARLGHAVPRRAQAR